MQIIFVLALVAGGIYLVASNADNWSDWVVFAVILITTYGFSVAITHRKYPTRKRPITRSSR